VANDPVAALVGAEDLVTIVIPVVAVPACSSGAAGMVVAFG
jgi:hypothetical protein